MVIFILIYVISFILSIILYRYRPYAGNYEMIKFFSLVPIMNTFLVCVFSSCILVKAISSSFIGRLYNKLFGD